MTIAYYLPPKLLKFIETSKNKSIFYVFITITRCKRINCFWAFPSFSQYPSQKFLP